MKETREREFQCSQISHALELKLETQRELYYLVFGLIAWNLRVPYNVSKTFFDTKLVGHYDGSAVVEENSSHLRLVPFFPIFSNEYSTISLAEKKDNVPDELPRRIYMHPSSSAYAPCPVYSNSRGQPRSGCYTAISISQLVHLHSSREIWKDEFYTFF